jgi:hypothetical protein
MTDRKQAIADHMRHCHEATWPVLTALSDDERRQPALGDGEAAWTVGDVVAHLADAEAGLLGQVQRLLAGKQTVPEDFDLDRWNRRAVRRNRDRPHTDLLEQIRASHLAALETLAATEEAALDLKGRHSSGDILTAEGFFRRMADHRQAHTRDILRALGRAEGLVA